GALAAMLCVEAAAPPGAGDGGRRLGGPVDLQGSGELERGAGLGVDEEQSRGRMHGGVAEGLEEPVPQVVAPEELPGPGDADESGRSSAMGGVCTGVGVHRAEEKRLGRFDPLALAIVELV